MKFYKILFTVGLLALVQSQFVSAATFDFVGYADNDSDGDGHYEYGYATSGFVVTEDSITLTATGKYNGGLVNAYLDGGNAGLGVCQAINAGNKQCTDSGDDNVTVGETLLLDFGQTVKLETLDLSNGGHGSSFDGTFGLVIDGVNKGNITLSSLVTLNLIGKIFELSNNNQIVANNKEFYISSLNVSAVPIPAAVFLFAPALLGFMGLRRKATSSVA